MHAKEPKGYKLERCKCSVTTEFFSESAREPAVFLEKVHPQYARSRLIKGIYENQSCDHMRGGIARVGGERMIGEEDMWEMNKRREVVYAKSMWME